MTQSIPPPKPPSTKSVTLTVYEWHALLRELEYLFAICNRDQHNAKALYNLIATELHGETVNVFEEDAKAKAAQQAKSAPVEQSSSAPRSFWRRLF